jgi:hypothetical protein
LAILRLHMLHEVKDYYHRVGIVELSQPEFSIGLQHSSLLANLVLASLTGSPLNEIYSSGTVIES